MLVKRRELTAGVRWDVLIEWGQGETRSASFSTEDEAYAYVLGWARWLSGRGWLPAVTVRKRMAGVPDDSSLPSTP